ncbi:MAG: hypothetical protein QMD10_12530 [Desulfitobacteriaceae bacterium]|nr:hypothetical protein [Desulfitobacteriaceae bacterium]
MKVAIAKAKENGTKYIASLVTEQGPALPQRFDNLRSLITYIREERDKARALGQPFDLVRKPN